MDQSLDDSQLESSHMRLGPLVALLLVLAGCSDPPPEAPREGRGDVKPAPPPLAALCGPGSEQDSADGACFHREDVAPGLAQWIGRVIALPGGPSFLRVGFDALPGDADTIPFMERSDDSGRTWTALQVPTIATPGTLGGSARAVHLIWLEVAPDGSWHLSGNAQTYEALVTTGGITAWAFHMRSDDEGATWAAPTFWPTISRSWPGRVAVINGTVLMTWDRGQAALDYALSHDGGATWTEPRTIQDCLLQSHLAAINGSFRLWCTNMGRHARFLSIDVDGRTDELGRATYAESAGFVTMGSRIEALGPDHLIAFLDASDAEGARFLHESHDDGRTWTRWPALEDLLPEDLHLRDGNIDCLAVDAHGRIHLTAIYEVGETDVTGNGPVMTLWAVLGADQAVLHHQAVMRWEGYPQYYFPDNPAVLFPPAFGSCGAFTPAGGLIEARGSQDILRILV